MEQKEKIKTERVLWILLFPISLLTIAVLPIDKLPILFLVIALPIIGTLHKPAIFSINNIIKASTIVLGFSVILYFTSISLFGVLYKTYEEYTLITWSQKMAQIYFTLSLTIIVFLFTLWWLTIPLRFLQDQSKCEHK